MAGIRIKPLAKSGYPIEVHSEQGWEQSFPADKLEAARAYAEELRGIGARVKVYDPTIEPRFIGRGAEVFDNATDEVIACDSPRGWTIPDPMAPGARIVNIAITSTRNGAPAAEIARNANRHLAGE